MLGIYFKINLFKFLNINKKSKLKELEEEVRVLSNTLKSLEVSENEAKQREINFAELMRESAEELSEVCAFFSKYNIWRNYYPNHFEINIITKYEERADTAESEGIQVQKRIDQLEGLNFCFCSLS